MTCREATEFLFDYLDGKTDRATTIALVQTRGRQFAKRQLTWFRRDPRIVWFGGFGSDPRIAEAGLDAVRKPDAFATVILKLSTYRKLEPGHWEEVIFYDHPSGRTRIESAMRWKKEHIADTDIRDTAQLP